MSQSVPTGAIEESMIETETAAATAPGREIAADQEEIVRDHQKGGIQTAMTGDIRDLGIEMVHSDTTTGTAGGTTTTTEIAEVRKTSAPSALHSCISTNQLVK